MKASCQCGQLKAKVPGPTIAVVACHCLACQKRSGSPFGEAAYWPNDDVVIAGKATQFDRPTDLGGVFSQFFCPHCGTTVYMRGTKNPSMTGVPIGLFDDPHFNAANPVGLGRNTSRLGRDTDGTSTLRARADRLRHAFLLGNASNIPRDGDILTRTAPEVILG